VFAFLAPNPRGELAGTSKAPTFAVAIAAYQAADFVIDAIESVLTQTRPADEIIVCDDGSRDDLERILEPYRDVVLYIRQEHRGAGAARNTAIAAARSDFVAILDADDVFLPGYLEAVDALARARPDLDILTTNAYVEIDGRIIGSYYPDLAKFVVGDQRRGAIHNHFVFGLAALRRDRIVAVGGFDEQLRRSEDSDCFLRMILSGSVAGLVDERLARYRLRPDSRSSDRVAGMVEELNILEKARDSQDLTPPERTYLDGELAVKRQRVRLARAEDAVRRGTRDARSQAFGVAFGPLPPGFGPRTRISALAAAVSPAIATHLLNRAGSESLLRASTLGR
jgi:glycosyltransferase involved in cell wall biosynthesis